MVVAILAVHADNGLFMSNNGYEFGLALLAISISLAFTGAGAWSVDAQLRHGNAATQAQSVSAGARNDVRAA